MPIRFSDTCVFTLEDAQNALALATQSEMPGTQTIYSDVNRTDSYTADGTFDRPFKAADEAIALANSLATASTPYLVTLAPGVYNLPPITLAPYVKLYGSGWIETILKATDLSNNFITLGPSTVLRNVNIWGPTLANKAAVIHTADDPRPAVFIDSTISRGYYGLRSCPAVSLGNVLVQNISFAYSGNNINTFFKAEGYSEIYLSGCIVSGPTGPCPKIPV